MKRCVCGDPFHVWTVFPFQTKTDAASVNLYFHLIKFSLYLSLSTGYQILTKKISRFRPFSSIRISSDPFYLTIIVNWHLTFAVCPKPDSKFL